MTACSRTVRDGVLHRWPQLGIHLGRIGDIARQRERAYRGPMPWTRLGPRPRRPSSAVAFYKTECLIQLGQPTQDVGRKVSKLRLRPGSLSMSYFSSAVWAAACDRLLPARSADVAKFDPLRASRTAPGRLGDGKPVDPSSCSRPACQQAQSTCKATTHVAHQP